MANKSSPCVQFEDNNIHSLNGWLPCEPYHKGGPVVSCCKKDGECLDYGLCHYDHSLVGGSGYYQGSCTDPNYENSLCPHLCNDQPFPDVKWNETLNEWQCCGANSKGEVSCNAPTTNEFFDAPAPSLLSTTATPGQTTSAKGTRTRTRTPATGTKSPTVAPATSAPASSSGLSTGAKAGIGVGAALGALVVIGLIAWFLLRRRSSKKAETMGSASGMDSQAQHFQQDQQPLRHDYKYDQGYGIPLADLPAESDSAQRFEMPQPGVESYADNMRGPKIYPLSNEHAPRELPGKSSAHHLSVGRSY
ncbi:hypothetical protein NA57DRAFT_78827 [Rhizodiscina lignyota]|uniref:Uncharacterized protein n=1 Tax=Rhizodiscina lignyota TaxID=1504668 RepID=A0A9P4M686_9PEZI|nr:hypothetical protein NA57DRAFT_78827 [Rhizodiscina lignyota]